MKTALIISEMLELHDDELIADIEQAFHEIDRSVERTQPGDYGPLMLIVDELVDELLAPREPQSANELTISLELDLDFDEGALPAGEVAEVA